jgi:hypothetical protein
MKRLLSISGSALIILFLLVSCAPKFSVEDVPVPTDVVSSLTDGHYMKALWDSKDLKFTEGPYDGYTIDGVAYYIISEDAPQNTLSDFYQDKLTALDWKSGDVTINIDGKTGTLYTAQPWTKKDRVILLAVYPTSSFMNKGIGNLLIIYLLTK